MLEEFSAFLAEYNVVGTAIGLLVAVKVGDLVKSFVEDFVTPSFFYSPFQKTKDQ